MCTLEKRGRVYVLTLTGSDEHRLNFALIDSILAALRRIRSDPTPGSALVTTADGKFFSNGFDLTWARSAGSSSFHHRLHLMVARFQQVVADLFSLPIPTIAAVSGHAAAAGFLFALSHDYIFMRKDRGFLFMSEINLGISFPDYFMAVMRAKITSPGARRDVVQQAAKIPAGKAVEMGIIDAAHDSVEETVVAAMRLGEELAGKMWNGEVYAGIRKASFPEVSKVLGLVDEKEEKKVVTKSRL